MASKRPGKGPRKDAGSGKAPLLPAPFKALPAALEPFCEQLSPKHVYIAHVDRKPRAYKRRIFLIPVAMNLAVALLFVLRVWYIGPYYLQLLQTALGTPNETTLVARQMSWLQLVAVVLRRTCTFMLDLLLAIFVWPWPVEFCFSSRHGNPVGWRWIVGFRDIEIYVRRSRSWYVAAKNASSSPGGPGGLGLPPAKDWVHDGGACKELVGQLEEATSARLLQKTGYLTMNAKWDLDWNAMVWATTLVDKKELPLEHFAHLAVLHHYEHGWLCVDMQALAGAGLAGPGAADEDRRRQIFAFQDALTQMGEEDLFFRWIEIIQYEVSRPGGLLHNPEKQREVAQQVRDLFQTKGIDFDKLWAECVDRAALA